MKTKFKLNAITSIVLASWLSQPVLAQEQTQAELEAEVEKKEVEESGVEVIEVKGFRGSLQKSLNSKRFRDAVSDSIHAEDVGKSTDQNIADALSRVTGIVVQEESGEGTRITVRGASPDQNQISINGITLTGGLSGGGDNDIQNNSVDLSSFSADILSSIDVVKSPAADQNEGSLGANIELNTVRPLSLRSPRRTITVEGRHNQFSEDEDYRVVGSFADKFFDDRLGVIVTASRDRQNTRVDNIITNFRNVTTPIADALNPGIQRPATDLATGNPIRVLGFQRDGGGNLILDDQGQPIPNPIESLVDFDPATQTLVEGDLFVLSPANLGFSLNTDIRDRFTVSAGIQYELTENTMVQLDINHTQQDVFTDNQRVNLNLGNDNAPLLSSFDDNIANNVVDLTTNTLVRQQSRAIGGNSTRAVGARELETNVVTLNVQHNFNDRLSANLRLGYSRTEDETPLSTDPEAFVTIRTGPLPVNVADGLPESEVELVGFDCTTGPLSECDFITGTSFAQRDPFDNSVISASSRFNPRDLQSNSLNAIIFRNNSSSDTNRSAFLDFDYELDYKFLTSLEFGGKYVERIRDIQISNVVQNNAGGLIENIGLDDDADIPERAFGTIPLGEFVSNQAFPFDDFGGGLQRDTSAQFFGGFPLIDATRAIEIASGFDAEQVNITVNPQGTRDISRETVAAYFKANFEFFDGRLSGNVGVRYVHDDIEASGIGGVRFAGGPNQLTPFDLFVTRNLADPSNPVCPEVIPTNGDNRVPANADELQNCFAVELTHAINPLNGDTFPFDRETGQFIIPGADGQTGIDVNRLVFLNPDGTFTVNPFPQQIFDVNGNLVDRRTGAAFQGNFGPGGILSAFLDTSTSTFPLFGNPDGINNVTGSVSDSNSLDRWLPSITFNYGLNEETIIRLGLSRTLTRPNIDLLNPSASINDTPFNVTNGRTGNTQLEPLSSNNIDISYEWYFNESGLLSAALFYKDFDDFVSTVTSQFQFIDVRGETELDGTPLVLEFDPNRTPADPEGCQPARQTFNFINAFDLGCEVALLTTSENGGGGSIRGVELGYTQNYDFLPGFLSGFGATINYTYQESDVGEEEVPGTGQVVAALPFNNTPEHSANFTLFYEKDGLQVRLAHRWTGTQLISRNVGGNAIWQDPVGRLDLAASYRLNNTFTFTFNALNLNDDIRRRFVTGAGTLTVSGGEVGINEGNVFDDSSITTDRTQSLFRFGRQFRFGVRATF